MRGGPEDQIKTKHIHKHVNIYFQRRQSRHDGKGNKTGIVHGEEGCHRTRLLRLEQTAFSYKESRDPCLKPDHPQRGNKKNDQPVPASIKGSLPSPREIPDEVERKKHLHHNEHRRREGILPHPLRFKNYKPYKSQSGEAQNCGENRLKHRDRVIRRFIRVKAARHFQFFILLRHQSSLPPAPLYLSFSNVIFRQ